MDGERKVYGKSWIQQLNWKLKRGTLFRDENGEIHLYSSLGGSLARERERGWKRNGNKEDRLCRWRRKGWLKRRSPRRVGRENNSTGYINAFHPPFSNVPLPDVVLLNRRRMWSRLSRSQSVSFIWTSAARMSPPSVGLVLQGTEAPMWDTFSSVLTRSSASLRWTYTRRFMPVCKGNARVSPRTLIHLHGKCICGLSLPAWKFPGYFEYYGSHTAKKKLAINRVAI